MSTWPKKVCIPLPGRTIAQEICNQLGLESYVVTAMDVEAITVTFTVDQAGHILVVSLWRGKEETGT